MRFVNITIIFKKILINLASQANDSHHCTCKRIKPVNSSPKNRHPLEAILYWSICECGQKIMTWQRQAEEFATRER